VLKSLNSAEYKQVLSGIKHCILATDLALFFPNKAKLSGIVSNGALDWNNQEHRFFLGLDHSFPRNLSQAILMTACDLIGAAKPWQVQTETVKVIFEEFYEQVTSQLLRNMLPPRSPWDFCHLESSDLAGRC
jgi:cAMP and cAMP-inhibited cGMP 3',5'-cyclic phosphodiesterase 10